MHAQPSAPEVSEEEALGAMTGQSHVVQPTYQNALGRASLGRVTEAHLKRASVVRGPAILCATPKVALSHHPLTAVIRLQNIAGERSHGMTHTKPPECYCRPTRSDIIATQMHLQEQYKEQGSC